jgi:CIC family chloride channel protein
MSVIAIYANPAGIFDSTLSSSRRLHSRQRFMDHEPELAADSSKRRDSHVALALLSLIAGTASGVLAAVFRVALERGDRFRNSVLIWAHGERLLGFLLIIGMSASATGLAAWLVRRFSPEATGSGIPQIEAALQGRCSGSPLRIIAVKFLGGLLALGTGLALGREGPTVQMGASLSELVGRVFRRNQGECRALLAAGAGAGLATAFNAPIAGAVFVLEELVGRFDLRMSITTIGASASAIGVARLLLGQAPDFHVEPFGYPGFGAVSTHLLLGIVIGLVGVAYSRAIVGALSITAQLRHFPVELRAALIGATVGLLAWFAPSLVGSGDAITQRVLGGTETIVLFGLGFAVRFGLGVLSYAARTPGGLFAPMLVLGSQSGLLFGTICHHWFPSTSAPPTEFAVVGMAALFAAVVQAPLTGIILAIELTGSFTLFLPMLGASFAAMMVPVLLRNPSIYESLRLPLASEPGSKVAEEK